MSKLGFIIFLVILALFIGQASASVQVVASNTLQASNDTNTSSQYGSWKLQKQIPLSSLGNLTGSFNGSVFSLHAGLSYNFEFRKNGVAISGTTGTAVANPGSTQKFTFSENFNSTDIFEVWANPVDAGYIIGNFRLMYDVIGSPEVISKASNQVQYSNNTITTTTSTSLVLLKSIPITSNISGTYRVQWTYKRTGTGGTVIYTTLRLNSSSSYTDLRSDSMASTTNKTVNQILSGRLGTYQRLELWGYTSSASRTLSNYDFNVSYDTIPPTQNIAYSVFSFDDKTKTGFTDDSNNYTVANGDVRINSASAGIFMLSNTTYNFSTGNVTDIWFDYITRDNTSASNAHMGLVMAQNTTSYIFFDWVPSGGPAYWQIKQWPSAVQLSKFTYDMINNTSYRVNIRLSDVAGTNTTLSLYSNNGTLLGQTNANTSQYRWSTGKLGFWSNVANTQNKVVIDNLAYNVPSLDYYDDAETANTNWTNDNSTNSFFRYNNSGNWVYKHNDLSSVPHGYYLNNYYPNDFIFTTEVNYSGSTGYFNIMSSNVQNNISNQTLINSNLFTYNIDTSQLKLSESLDTGVATTSYTYTMFPNITYYLKGKKISGSVYLKAWKKGTDEPAWMLSANYSNLTTGFFGLRAYGTDITFDNISISTTITETEVVAPSIAEQWSSEHGTDNNGSVNVIAPYTINFNVTVNGGFTTVNWTQDGIQIQKSNLNTFSKTFSLAPINGTNISAQACDLGACSNTVYWLINTSANTYNGSTPTNLLRLVRPPLNQTQYIYGNNFYFFNTTYSEGGGWILNNNSKNSSCKGADGCNGLSVYPLEFWIRPLDGVVNINYSKISTFSNISIYVNNSLVADLNISGTGDAVYTLTGLNPLNISYIKINNTATNTGFILNEIHYNRSYPALYDGSQYFQMKKIHYETGTNLSGNNHNAYDSFTQSQFYSDIQEISNYSFNTISYPLIWKSFVDDIRPQSNGSSDNLYNYSSINTLDYIIDNASQNGLYVALIWTTFDTQYGGSGISMPTNVSQIPYTNISANRCTHCLVNSSESDSIVQLIKYISNRYKNHTNVQFELLYPFLTGYVDPVYYSDTENLNSWHNYSGYSTSTLPHDETISKQEYLSLLKWQFDNFMTLSNKIIPTLHDNNQLLSVDLDTIKSYYCCTNYYEYSSRLISNISDFDYIGSSLYLSQTDTLSSFDNYSYDHTSNLKSFGSVNYVSEFGVRTDWNYSANVSSVVNQTISKSITNISLVDYNNQSVGYGVAGYLWWMWKEGGTCGVSSNGQPCIGAKYKNDTFTSWASTIKGINSLYVTGLEFNPPASITSPQTTRGNFYINNTWTDPADADFDHVYFAWSNGTSMNMNVSKGVQFMNMTYIPHYIQNISAQTVDTSGNVNVTLIWFNATIQNNVPVQSALGNKIVIAGQWINFSVNATDADGDVINYGTNASKGILNTTTGDFNWSTTGSDVGTYYWNFNSSDGYGGVATETITITVTSGEYIPPTPIDISYSNGTTWVNHTWQAGAGNTTNSFNISHNGTWVNGTTDLYYNVTVGYSAWSNITIYAFNSSGNGTLNNTGISENVKTPDAPVIIYIPPAPVWISNITGSYWINHTWTSGSGNITDSFNVSHNGTWMNGSLTPFLNASLDPLGWSNITIWAYNNTGMLSLTSISNNSQAPSAPITNNGTPNITAWFNDKNGWNQTTLTVYISNSVIFNVTINQSVTNVSWKVEGSEEQNTSSLQFTRAFNSLGSYNVTAQGFNQNGSSNVVYTVVSVITGPGGGTGTDWDFARGWVKYPNGTAISGVAVITSVGTEYTDGSGYYSFGYSFIHGDTYNFNFTKSGYNYSSQDITFSTGDYQIVNATLDILYVPPVNGTPIIASWGNNFTNNDNLSMIVVQNTTVLFNATSNQTITSWVWTTASIIGGNGTTDTSASYNFTVNGTTQISIYGINGNGTTQTKTWTVQVGNGTTVNNSTYGFDTTMDINLFYFIMVLGGVLFYLALRSYAGIRMALGWLTVGVFVAMAIFFAKGGVITTSFVTDTLGVTTVPLVLGISSSLLVIFYIILAIIAMLVAIATSS